MNRIRSHPAYPYVIRILLIGLVIVLAFQVTRIRATTKNDQPGTTDLVNYWAAGQLLRAGENPYDQNALDQVQLGPGSLHPTRIWNPPWLLLWIFPFLLLAFPTATTVWFAVNFGIILTCGTILWRIFASPPIRKQVGMAWVATIAFVPALFTLRMGQITTIVLLGTVGFLYFASRDSDFLAGMCLALTTVKPHTVYLVWIAVVWWVIQERRWKTVGGAASLLLPTLVPLTLMWPGWVSGYRANMIANPPWLLATPTIGGILRLFVFPETPLIQFVPAIVAGLSLLGYLTLKRPALNWKTALSPLLLISTPTAAFGWSFDYIVLLVPYIQIIIWLTGGQAVAIRYKATLVASLLLIAALMVIQNLLKTNDAFFFWMPWALGAAYLYAHAGRSIGITPSLSYGREVAYDRL